MQSRLKAAARWGALLCIFALTAVAAVLVLPYDSKTKAAGGGKGLLTRTESNDPGLPNYDIREQKGDQITDYLMQRRASLGKSASAVADIRDGFVQGEEALRSRVPTLKVEYNTDIRIPEVIGPDVNKGRNFLTGPSSGSRVEALRAFAKQNNDLIGVTDQQIDSLKVTADYTNPDGNLSFTHLEQSIGGVPVFRGEIKAGFTKKGEIIRVINNLAPGIDYNSVSTDFGSPAEAVKAAARSINYELKSSDTSLNSAASTELKAVFGQGDWATTAEKMYFPTEPGVAVPAWRVLIWQPVNAYYVIVDANDGTMLWRKNITEDQTQSATYQVYNAPNSWVGAADSPAPLSPGPLDPTLGTQGPLGTRTNVTLVGNEAPNTFNNNGWITDGANVTDGNALEAGIDRDGTNGVDAPQVGSPNRVFNSTWNPAPGNPTPGDDPLTAQAQRGAVIQMFYVMNRWHDRLYQLGFTEQAFNFQHDNFGRGGVANDRVSAEGQDSSGTNNANFSTPADGGRGRMQMYVWTGPTPDYDGTADAEVIIHEVTHGLSNRLHGNASGLSTNMSRGMGEGWGDFYGYAMLAEPTDPINGIYTTGGYATYLISAGFTGNYYYGIRRFPRAPITFLGGPDNKPHNPFTFRYVNADCNTLIGTTSTNPNSAFPRGPIGSSTCDQVHNLGEIWSSALWEVRNRMVARLGFTAGTTRVLQVVTDGMKLAPIGPTFLQERDAIIAAAQALPSIPEANADVTDVREGFRVRGMGFSASIQNAGTGANNTVVTEAFDGWTLAPTGTASVTSGNGLLEPNECNTLNVPISNNGSATATGISAVLTSNTPGITVTQANSAYPDIPAGGGPVNNTTPFQVSVANSVACFTQASFTLTVTFSGSGGGSPVVSNFSLPVGLPGNVYTFTSGTGATIPAGGTLVAGSAADDAAVTIPLPSGWTSTLYDVPVTSLSASTNGMITANGTAATTFTNTTLPASVGGTNPTIFPLWDDYDMDPADVTGGGIYTNVIGSAPNRQLVIEWRAQHFAETTNGPITVNFATVLYEGTGNFRNLYVQTGISPNQNGASATVGVQRQSTGTQFTQFSFNTASITPGMTLDGTLPAGQCTPGSGVCNAVPTRRPFDFDGDGKTDVSVFRPGASASWW
ncbi:MAG: M36 family metallopeptidase, partial [Pyrinomonadaceae bacterium]